MGFMEITKNNKMESLFPLFYESTYLLLSDGTNRFYPENERERTKKKLDRIDLQRAYILRSWINLFFNEHHIGFLIKKSSDWLHAVPFFLISDHEELQKVTIEFLSKFIDSIKRLD